MINAVTANFLGDNLQCWMQIQVGKGPWSSEVSGIVKIGQTMTMVMGIKVRALEMVTLAASSHDHDCLCATFVELQTKVHEDFTVTEMAPSR